MTPKKLIEVAFPLKQTSIDSVHEKNVRHGHISTLHIWPARRPLAASRAVLIASLLDDPGNEADRQILLDKLAGKVIKKSSSKKKDADTSEGEIKEETIGGILHWGRESGSDLEWFREEIKKAYGGRAPKVLDPFSGGGAIPLEAMRMGCETTAMDINPVAWFILKCTLEYPQKFSGKKISLPEFILKNEKFMESFLKAQGFKGRSLELQYKKILQETGKDAYPPHDKNSIPFRGEDKLPMHIEGELPFTVSFSNTKSEVTAESNKEEIKEFLNVDLAWQVRAWGQWVLDEARKDLEKFYPVVNGNPTVAYLWARTVECKNCRTTIPLLKTTWLCKKPKKNIMLVIHVETEKETGRDARPPVENKITFTIEQNPKGDLTKLGKGTMSRSGATCPVCKTVNTMEDIRIEGKRGRLGEILTAVVVDTPRIRTGAAFVEGESNDSIGGKEYRLPTQEELDAANLHCNTKTGRDAYPTNENGGQASLPVDRTDLDVLYDSFAVRILAFVKESLEDSENKVHKMELWKVDEKEAEILKEATGLDLKGYTHDLENYAIKHIFKEHSDPKKEEPRGQIAITREHIPLIPIILKYPDKITAAKNQPAGKEVIIYEKELGDLLIYLEEVRTGKKELATKTMRIVKKGGVKIPPEGSLNSTSETDPRDKQYREFFKKSQSKKSPDELLQELYKDIPFGIPNEPMPSKEALGFRAPLYGLDRWDKLFTKRQLYSLGTFVKHTRRVRDVMRSMGYSEDWIEAIGVYLACTFDRMLDFNSQMVTWMPTVEAIGHTFVRYALPMTWDYSEPASPNYVRGGWLMSLDAIIESIYTLNIATYFNNPIPDVKLKSAKEKKEGFYDLILTDPPYYDAIPYSDLMDYFFIWNKRLIGDLFQEDLFHIFSKDSNPKWNHETNDGELIDDDSRFGGDENLSKQNYEDGMYQVFRTCNDSLTKFGILCVVFANKQADAWETLVSSIIKAGFYVSGSWPIQTEQAARLRAQSSAALASSIWLVCRKRPETARPGWDTNVIEEMRENIREKLEYFWKSGIRGPDFVWSATGPALEAYSKYPVVKRSDAPDSFLAVGEFLKQVRKIVVDFVVQRVLSGETSYLQGTGKDAYPTGENVGQASLPVVQRNTDITLDPVTNYYILHRYDYGMLEVPAGACILYAISCGVTDKELADNYHLLKRTNGKATIGEEEEEEVTSGGNFKLRNWNERTNAKLGLEAPKGKEIPLIDKAHKLLFLWKAGDVTELNSYIESQALKKNELFHRVVQALIELSPLASEERSLLESISNHITGVKYVHKQEKLI